MISKPPPLFFSADWGSTHFRLRLLTDDGARVLGEVVTPQGAAAVAQAAGDSPRRRAAAYAACLRAAITALCPRHPTGTRAAPVVISGMATSAYGWQPVPYATLPFRIDGSAFSCETRTLTMPARPSHRLYFLGGVRTAGDVMRGEESQLVGLNQFPEAQARLQMNCLVLLPGTHAKHVRVTRGRIVDFQTFMTGELYALLASQSVLRHTVAATQPGITRMRGFRKGFREGAAAASRDGLAANLFRIRARGVLGAAPALELSGYLSGLLIGSEMSGRLLRAATGIMLCADPSVAPLYTLALRAAGRESNLHVIPAARVQQLAGRGHGAFLRRLAAESTGSP